MSAEAAIKWAEAKEALDRADAALAAATETQVFAHKAERAAWAVLEGLANGIKRPAQQFDRAPVLG